MKKKINQIVLLTFFALFIFTSCQDEAVEVDNPNEQEVLTSNSSLVSFMSNVTANYGAYDNILDESDCFSIELPVTIIVNDVTIIVENENDLEQLEELFDDYDENEDFLDFIFPITIIFNDYTEIIIENEEQLEAYIEDCIDEEDEVIECIDFVYPISFSVFNSNFNSVDTVIIENDEALYHFLNDLNEDESALIVSLNYPITLEYVNGETIEVNSNEELIEAIEGAAENCDDEGDDCDEDDVAGLLLECPWNINNENEDFENYQIIFHESGDLQILEGDTTSAIGGLWSLSSTDEVLVLNFYELTAFQDDLGGEWLIVECDEALEIVHSDYEIELVQDCESSNEQVFDCFDDFELVECLGPNNEAEFNLSADTIGLIDCPYEFLPSFHETQEDAENNVAPIAETESYWSEGGEVYLRIESVSGNFEVFTIYLNTEECNYFECFGNYNLAVCDEDDGVEDGFGVFDLNLIFDNCPNDDVTYNFYLTVADAEAEVNALVSPFVNTVSYEQTIYSRVSLAGNPNIFEIFSHTLIVENCYDEGCSEEDVDAFLIECIWNAVNYNGSDNLMNWNFDFESNSQIVVIYTDTDTIDATWTTSQSDEGIVVTFANVAGPNIQAITGEWLVIECEENRLELHRADDILVLERTCD